MERKHFLIITSVLAWIFGLTMMFAPEKMVGNLTVETNTAVNPSFPGLSDISISVRRHAI